MKTKYLALTPIDTTTIDIDDIPEALAEFGCEERLIDNKYYIVCNDAKALSQMMHTLDLPGSFVEFTAVWHSKEEASEMIID